MSAGLRGAVYTVFGVLWVSGAAWLVVHLLFPQQTSFGPAPNPWEPAILRVHGWTATAAMFLLGWISARHIVDRWPLHRRRPSGLLLSALGALLVLSGYALYYTTDRLHASASMTHEILGAAGILLAVLHWYVSAARRGRLANQEPE